MKEAAKPRLSRCFCILLFLAFCCFGVFAPRLGFYLDDWPLLEILNGGGRWGAFGAWLGRGMQWTRPVEALLYPAFFLAGGLRPLPYHILLSGLGLAEAWLLFRTLERLIGRRDVALIAAVLAEIHPNRAVFYIWFSNSPQPMAHILLLAGLLAHLRWAAGRCFPWLAASLSLYLAALLCYESVAFMPLILGAGLAAEAYCAGRDLRESSLKGLRVILPFALPMALGLGWQWAGAPLLLHQANPKASGLAITLGHILKAYGAGFECIANRTLHICVKGAAAALTGFQPGQLLLWAFVTAAAAKCLLSESDEPGDRAALGRAAVVAAALFVAGYAPYALSGAYTPQIYGIMSRTNGLGAWAGALGLAGVAAALGKRARSLLLGAILGAFIWTDWASNSQWIRAWGEQRRILGSVLAQARALPPRSTVLLSYAPHYAGYAVIFDATYDFSSALRLETGRRDLKGDVVVDGFQFGPKEVVHRSGDEVLARYPYRNLYFYRAGPGTLERLNGPPNNP